MSTSWNGPVGYGTIAWDLDGTLLETREANLMAYRSLGVEPPIDFNIRPWREWTDKETHDRKNFVIGPFLRTYCSWLPCVDVWRRYPGPVVTMCSHPVLAHLKFVLPADMTILRADDREGKLRILRNLGPSGIYVDDSPRMRKMVNEELSGWIALDPLLVSSLPQEKVDGLLSGDIHARPM